MINKIIVKGAREHNLKNITVEIPRDKMTVITGLSGSGKSTLAFDTIYAEGQRRYVESLSAYARQFLGIMNKPDVDSIEGLSPAISIEQKTTSKNPRSTVGTITEIYDYMRLLFARIGHPKCPQCGKNIIPQSVDMIADSILTSPKKTKIQILAPIVRGKKGTYEKLFSDLEKQGFVRVRVDDGIYELADSKDIKLEKYAKHNIEVIIDRIKLTEKDKETTTRLTDALETALKLGDGLVIATMDGKEKLFSTLLSCPDCKVNFPEMQPRMFSFNNPFGACPDCHGLGVKQEFDEKLVIPDENLSVMGGGIIPWTTQIWGFRGQALKAVAKHFNFDLHTPIKDLKKEHKHILLYGTKEKIHFKYKAKTTVAAWEHESGFEGIIPQLKRLYMQTDSPQRREDIEKYMTSKTCPACNGKRLNPEALSVEINKKSIFDTTQMSIEECKVFFENLTPKLTPKEIIISKQILKEIIQRLNFLVNVGLNYLSLSRSSGTLSGGEAQRIRLATQIGSNLMGVIYILDEPSIGLHQRENNKLISTLKRLRDIGNTVIIVEHDDQMMQNADYLIDIGPGAGIHGGEIVAAGTPKEVSSNRKSITGLYLSNTLSIPTPNSKTRRVSKNKLTVVEAAQNNLKNITVDFPLGIFCCITGVSGSGKSSLINDTLYRALSKKFFRATAPVGKHKEILGLEHIDKVIGINQTPIGRTPRSNPATYVGLFTDIRTLFSKLPESRARGYKPGRFSFNVAEGRCETCQGDGLIKIEMHFLPDVYVECEECKGKRYKRETLEINYRGKNISDILDMTIEEALEFFKAHPSIKRKLQTLVDVGLEYIKLGQPATTLSGGEAQRIKLSTELSKKSTGKTVYVLDEPTTGLHFHDIKKLLEVLNRLVDKGNTVIVIEHNLDVIKSADHIIDLGPEGGDKGGNLVVCGTPEQVVACKKSYTGKFLGKIIYKKSLINPDDLKLQ